MANGNGLQSWWLAFASRTFVRQIGSILCTNIAETWLTLCFVCVCVGAGAGAGASITLDWNNDKLRCFCTETTQLLNFVTSFSRCKTFIKTLYSYVKRTQAYKNRMNEHKCVCVCACESELFHAQFQHSIVTILVTESVLGLCDRNNEESALNLISFTS